MAVSVTDMVATGLTVTRRFTNLGFGAPLREALFLCYLYNRFRTASPPVEWSSRRSGRSPVDLDGPFGIVWQIIVQRLDHLLADIGIAVLPDQFKHDP